VKLNTGDKPVHLIFIPVSAEEGLQRMRDGKGDIAASNIPIIPQFQELVDFSDPIRERAREVLVTGPSAPPITSLEDLSGKEVFVRKLSRYRPNLERLNERFRSESRAPVVIKEADQNLQDEDILDMVNAGLVGVTVMDDLVAGFWSKVYDGISVHNDLSLADDDKIGWAVQKSTPKFLSLINEFVKDHKVGTSFGNVMLQKYLRDTKWAKNSVAPGEMEKFRTAVAFFKRYGGHYKFEWLMIAAQANQESTIDQAKTSSAGAVGVMQIKPVAAREIGAETVTYVSNIYKYYIAYQMAAENVAKRRSSKQM
jgi:membrane-bound lytic murein transglycosylase MltF